MTCLKPDERSNPYLLRRVAVLSADDRLEEAGDLLETLSDPALDGMYDLAVGEGLEPLLLAADTRASQRARAKRLRSAASRDLVIDGNLERVSDSLARAGVTFLLEKGAFFRDTIYPASWLRSMVDLDLLVLPRDRDPAMTALTGAGFTLRETSPSRPFSGRLSLERILMSPLGDLAVEVHCDLTHERFGFSNDLDGLFLRAQPTRWTGAGTLSWEDHLLHEAIHLARTGMAAPLKHYLDVDRLARNTSPDWDLLAERARSWGCATALYFTLDFARGLFGTPIPDHALDRTAPSGPRSWLLGGLLNREVEAKGLSFALWKSLVLPALYDRMGDSAGFVAWMAGTRFIDRLVRT
ncbi:MAG: nucleotidyltransferase family protein [Deltaproteobacteria bacterium]|nr:nucleotidyltransferase family protein [Deltaproteobacteria bacterium]